MATFSRNDNAESSIQFLPATTRTKLRSSQILTSLSQIVSELLQNSLDAGALQIEVGVDCEEWSCWVRDNGVGINKQDMNLLGKGSEEGRYGTSKAYSPDSLDVLSTFGFRGEALASAADLSCLEISSRTSKSRENWSIILKGGRTLYNGPSVRWRRESPGTAVCVRDAFYNLPIRRLSHPSPTNTMNLIRQQIETYALVFPKVSFSLENTNHSLSKGIIKVPKTMSTLAAFRHLYGRALAEHVEEIDETLDEMKLDGFISLHGAHSKGYQFLYINRHPLATCDLHRIIDNRFNSSSFMKNAYDEIGETGLPRSTVRRSPRKMERKHVYVLNLTLPPHHIDNCLEPAKASVHLRNRNVVSSFLSSVVQSFLVRHGFITQELLDQRRTKSDKSPSPSPSKRRKRNSTDNALMMPQLNSLSTSITVDEKDGTTAESIPIYVYHAMTDEDEVVWKDPMTGKSFIVDNRTGNSRTLSPIDRREGGEFNGEMAVSSRRTLPRTHNEIGEKVSAVPEWIQEALRENQAYALTEPKIPALSISSLFAPNAPASLPSFGRHSCSGHVQDPQTVAHYFQTRLKVPETSDLSRRFGRQDLRNAKIINQVDRKFITCLMDDGSEDPECQADGRALVLIDQHAADERVRVERFLKEICQGFLHWEDGVGGVRTREISPPMCVLLTRREALRLGSSNDIQLAFKGWGFRFVDLSQMCEVEGGVDVGNSEYIQVLVQSVPEIVGDKLLVGDELRELVKGFLGQLETDISPFPLEMGLHSIGEDASSTDTEFGWLKALRWCPRQLLDLINTKACRGAIMFNDSLSLDQCEQLVRQLSETAFPFQCAHGRPSLVPLVNIKARMGNHDGRQCRRSIRWTEFRH